MRTLPLPFLLTLLTAQDPAPAVPADLEALARRVEQAHLPKGPVPEVTAFRAFLEVHLHDAKAPDKATVSLRVQFLRWLAPGRKRPLPLMRYELTETSTPVVRGQDRHGPWHLVRGEPRDLSDLEKADLDTFEQHLKLAQQLLRFLSPARELRALQHPSAVTTKELVVARGKSIACDVVEGDLAAFPLLRRGGEDSAVHVEVYVEQASGRLLAIEATPLVDGKMDLTASERVLLEDQRERDDMLVPHRLLHLFRDETGKLRLATRTDLIDPSLRPELRAEDFDRPR